MSYRKLFLGPLCDPGQPASFPLFQPQQVQGGRDDGYWIEAFPFSTSTNDYANIIGYGLGTRENASNVQMFINPFSDKADNKQSTTWTSISLAELEFPVAMHYADITGNGYNDVIICDQYGPSMNEIWPNGGRVSWLENVGDPSRPNWTQRTIGRSPAMHRLKAGHFTRNDRVQVCAVPIIVKSSDLTTPAPVIIFTAPEDPRQVQGDWPSEVVTEKHLVHEVVLVPSEGRGFDQILLAGRDGVDLIWFDGVSWQTFNVGTGLPSSPGNPYWGAGSVAIARVDEDSAGYIASSEAFHGNTVSVYTKPTGSKHGIVGNQWTRQVLHDFGPLNEEHTGSIHQVICADIDGDGCDEFLVAMMGSDPADWNRTGVWCYKLQKETGTFTKTKLSNTSAGRIAVAHFTNVGRFAGAGAREIDFATISYSVPGYFESPNPSINIFLSTGILAERLDEEVSFNIVRASSTRFTTETEFLDVSARKLALVILPPDTSYGVAEDSSGVKVLAGALSWVEVLNKLQERTSAARPFGCQTMTVNAGAVMSGKEGAVFVVLKPSNTSGTPPYSSMDQLVSHNIFPATYSADVRAMEFPWVKVQDRPWAHGRFKDLEFYNLVGFHVHYADDSLDDLVHMQLWTAGKGVSAGFHNHVEKSFCEIHACIVNGTGQGGMRWATVPDQNFDPEDPDLDKTELVVVPDMHEHGPLWHTGPDGHPLLRMNDTIDYPWHAWLAGDGDPNSEQSFDVWVAFEFPSFETFSTPARPPAIKPGKYSILDPITQAVVILKDDNATDGTPVLATLPGVVSSAKWNIVRVAGTDLYEISHEITGSLLASRWPPVDQQSTVGTHSPANMGLTSRWAVDISQDGQISLRLSGTDQLFLSLPSMTTTGSFEIPVTLRQGGGAQPPTWSLV